MSSYSEKLKDPRWQKKRLEIFERDGWCCKWCQEEKETLSVHHLYYKRGSDPWDYPDDALITLCETCHEYEYNYRKEMEAGLLDILKRKGYNWSEIEFLIGFIDDLTSDDLKLHHILQDYLEAKKKK